MKSDISSIRAESNTYRSQLNELNDKIDEILVKYTQNKLGLNEMKKQIFKIQKLKDEILDKVLESIKSLEEIENKIKDNDSKNSSSKVVNIK